mgnify:CR=1 FL=1
MTWQKKRKIALRNYKISALLSLGNIQMHGKKKYLADKSKYHSKESNIEIRKDKNNKFREKKVKSDFIAQLNS